MSNLVKRLRGGWISGDCGLELGEEAADEIEWLRESLDAERRISLMHAQQKDALRAALEKWGSK